MGPHQCFPHLLATLLTAQKDTYGITITRITIVKAAANKHSHVTVCHLPALPQHRTLLWRTIHWLSLFFHLRQWTCPQNPTQMDNNSMMPPLHSKVHCNLLLPCAHANFGEWHNIHHITAMPYLQHLHHPHLHIIHSPLCCSVSLYLCRHGTAPRGCLDPLLGFLLRLGLSDVTRPARTPMTAFSSIRPTNDNTQ